MENGKIGEFFKGFSKLTRAERLRRLVEMGVLSSDDVRYLSNGGIQDIGLAEKFIENVIGYFQLPLGVTTNFRIDGIDHVIPMAVEETSIIAAASKTARWIRECGHITTKTLSHQIIGQVQLARVQDFPRFKTIIDQNKANLIELANKEVANGLLKRGGGVEDLVVRKIKREDQATMAVVHVLANACDAMGANIMNQVCEYLKGPIERLTGERVSICILSNLVDTKLTEARVVEGNAFS